MTVPRMGMLRHLDLAQRRIKFALTASALNPWRMPVLDRTLFAHKRVIIIGPAETVFEDLRDLCVDDYDLIVRMNSGIFLAGRHPGLLGSRTDLLFHNLNEDGPRSAGAIPAEVLRAHGVKTVVFPHWSFKGSKARLFRKRKELAGSGVDLKVLASHFCMNLRRDLRGHQPTVGSSAIAFFLGCDLAELAIHGFTFFTTPYAATYNDSVQTGDDALAWAAASEVHDPALEKALIAQRIFHVRKRGMVVCLGRNVIPHLQQ